LKHGDKTEDKYYQRRYHKYHSQKTRFDTHARFGYARAREITKRGNSQDNGPECKGKAYVHIASAFFLTLIDAINA
jgi:hypothetical protein